MRWVIRRNTDRLQNWHQWFAWHPVTIGSNIVWLERVERKGTYMAGWGDAWWSWEYRDAA